MATISKFAGTVSQTTGGHYVTFSNLGNIRNSTSGSWAVSSVLIQGKSESKNRPSSISCTNFGFNLPTGAEVKKVKVLYRYRKVEGSDYSSKYPKRVCNIPAPTISLLGVSGLSGKGVSPTTTMATNTKTFNVAGKVSRTQVNSSSFGVKINWPTNTNKWNGYLRVSYVKIEVEYVLSSYGVSVKKVSGGYNEEDYTIQLSISNVNKTGFNPSLTLSSPAGFSFKESKGAGSLVQNSARSFTWNPKLGSNVGTASIEVVFTTDVTYPSGQSSYSGTFTLSESLNGASNSHTAVITEKPVTSEESETGTPIITDDTVNPEKREYLTGVINEEIPCDVSPDSFEGWDYAFAFPLDNNGNPIYSKETISQYVYSEMRIKPSESSSYSPICAINPMYSGEDYTNPDGYVSKNDYVSIGFTSPLYDTQFKGTAAGEYGVFLYEEIESSYRGLYFRGGYYLAEPVGVIRFRINPSESDLSLPYCSIIEPTEEELNRLGDGYPYTAESLMKINGLTRYLHQENIITKTLTSLYELSNIATLTDLPNEWVWEYDFKTTSEYAMLMLSESNSTNADGNRNSLNFGIDGNTFCYMTSEADETSRGGSATTGTTYHLKVVKNGDGTCSFYVDDTLLGSKPCAWLDNYSTIYLLSLQYGTQGTKLWFTNSIYYGEGDTLVRDWYKNNRIGVFNNAIAENITITTETDPETGEVTETVTDSTDYENLTQTEIIENAEYWGDTVSNVNKYESVETQFIYNKEYPLYIIMAGDYPEAGSYGFNMVENTFANPCVIETTVYKEREQNGNYPQPITSLISLSEDSAELTIPTLNTSTPVILYGLPLDDGYGNTDTMHIRGMSITGTIEQSDELVLSAKLTTPQGVSGTRTIVINDQDTTIDSDNEFSIGGLGDLWGFTQAEMTNLDDWELELTVSNLLNESDANINLTDVMITFYTETIDQQLINVKVQNEDLSFYGAFVENVEIPEGLETDTDFLTIDGTDTNDAYRQNIREKTIELELSIGECDLETSTLLLRQLTALLVNEKDNYNRPIPKTIEFSHYPDVYYEYIMKDALDITQDMGAYKIKAKLVVPAGTSYSQDTKTTNITGFVQGVASVNPVITVKPQTDQITITETVTQQSFTMGYSGDWQTGIVEIDCEDRKAYLKTNEDDTSPVDISKYVDFQSDWFRLKGEYSFTGAGCIIRTVEYLERW